MGASTADPIADAADPVASALARFVAGLRLQDIPTEVSLRARHLMLDAIGCALAARGESFAAPFWSATRALSAGSTGRSGVMGYAERVTLRDAALLNGTLMHGLDYDDTHIAGVVHLTVAVLPALLALAGQRGLSGAQLLTAYVAGVETGARLAMAARGGFHRQGFHPTGVVGTFAAAWAAGHLLELDADQLIHAQGAALSMASGSLQFIEDGAWTKRWHAGWAAQAGMTAAALAAAGVVAPTAPYGGRYGLYASHLDDAGRQALDLSVATWALPGGDSGCGDAAHWELSDIAVKPFAMCHFVHAATDAAIAMQAALIARGLDATQVHDIEVLVPQAAVPLVCEPQWRKRRPGNAYEAKFSLPYAVASGLMRGCLGLRELEPAAYLDPAAQALMDRVRYTVDTNSTFPLHYSGEVRLTLADGTQLQRREAVNRGHADRPLHNDEVQAKFMDNATRHFARGHAQAVLDQVLRVDRLTSVRILEDLLAHDPLHARGA